MQEGLDIIVGILLVLAPDRLRIIPRIGRERHVYPLYFSSSVYPCAGWIRPVVLDAAYPDSL